jgi:hypothetical protein
LVPYALNSNDVHGYVPWDAMEVVIAWWDADGVWEMCFMFDGAADSGGYSSQFFKEIPEPTHWAPLPKPPAQIKPKTIPDSPK